MSLHTDFATAGPDHADLLRLNAFALIAAGDQGHDAELDEEDEVDDDADPHVDKQLDKGLKETFPASDPVSINPGAD